MAEKIQRPVVCPAGTPTAKPVQESPTSPPKKVVYVFGDQMVGGKVPRPVQIHIPRSGDAVGRALKDIKDNNFLEAVRRVR